MVEQTPAGIGEADAATIAQQQRLAQVDLQLSHLPAQCGLGAVINLKHLQSFVRVAELGSFSKAARVLDIALYNRLKPGVEAAQLIPPGARMGDKLPLLPPPPAEPVKESEPTEVPSGFVTRTARPRASRTTAVG